MTIRIGFKKESLTRIFYVFITFGLTLSTYRSRNISSGLLSKVAFSTYTVIWIFYKQEEGKGRIFMLLQKEHFGQNLEQNLMVMVRLEFDDRKFNKEGVGVWICYSRRKYRTSRVYKSLQTNFIIASLRRVFCCSYFFTSAFAATPSTPIQRRTALFLQFLNKRYLKNQWP